MTTSKQFYTKLEAKGLAVRKNQDLTLRELSYLKKILDKKQKILDLGCGYGRLTIPLAKQRYNIEGIDITPALIKKAKKTAKKERIKIKFLIGNMTRLPYKKDSFDAIICMWTVFNELSKRSDQLKAIKEMLRVLKANGFALIEMPIPYKIKNKLKILKYKDVGDEFIFKKNNPIVTGKIAGIQIAPSYRHDKNTLTKLMKESKIKKYKIFIDKFGGRKRLFIKFFKE